MSASDVTLIIGAGTSKAVGLPQFEDLRAAMVKGLCDRAGLDDEAEARSRAESLAPEMFFSLFEDEHVHVFDFLLAVLTDRGPGPAQVLLATAVQHGAVVWTLNFDTLIEDAASSALPRAVYPNAPDDRPITGGQLLKPHGSIDTAAPESNDRPSPLVITSKQMLSGLSATWRNRLITDIVDRDVIVWGYAGNDLDVMPIIVEAFRHARRVTWVAFSAKDRSTAHERFDDFSNVRIVEPDLDSPDPSGDVVAEIAGLLDLDVPKSPPAGPDQDGGDWAYEPVSLAAVANALGQLAEPQVARRVWWRALVHPSSAGAAVQKLGRSYLFDVPAVQVVALPLLNAAAAVSPARLKPLVWDSYLTAREGRGATADGDRLASRVDRTFGPVEEADDTAIDVHARVIAQLRLQGNLIEADRRAQALHARLTSHPDRPGVSQFMLGRVLYETIGPARLLGRVDDAASAYEQAQDQLRQPHIGFLWSAWILNEGSALALAAGDFDSAHTRNELSSETFENIGNDPRCRFDVDLRRVEIQRHSDPRDDSPIGSLDGLLLRAQRDGQLSTPFRLAEVHLELADAHRLAGRGDEAMSHAEAASRSPSAMHRALATFEAAMLTGNSTGADFAEAFTELGITPQATTAQPAREADLRPPGVTDHLLATFRDRPVITR